MASEIRVNKIENRSGLGTVTFADTGVDLAGIVTATTFSGSGASLTNVPDSALSAVTASKLSGALPAISAASLTNVPAANVVGVHTSLTVTNATTTGTAVVGGGVTISESGIEASGIGITCANINGTQIGGRRNIIINGSMQVAQHGISTTTSGIKTVDRWKTVVSGTDEAPTFAQTAVVNTDSGDNPFAKGITKTFKITNGNQTSGAQASSRIEVQTNLESADLRNSGWNYNTSADFITFSFYIKSSVAQKFAARLQTQYGTGQRFKFNTPTLTANTWTRVVQTIPGNANLSFNDTVDNGFRVSIYAFMGTTFTDSSATETWAANEGGNRADDMTTTWFTTNDATLEITGVQLEVGPQATAFEHRSFAEELLLCQRYFCKLTTRTDDNSIIGQGMYYGDTQIRCPVQSFVEMRAAPTVETTNSTDHFTAYASGSGVNFPTFDSSHQDHKGGIVLGATIAGNNHDGKAAYIISNFNASTGVGVVSLNAEL